MKEKSSRLYKYRTKFGYSQQQVADMLSLHYSTYGKMESGAIKVDIEKGLKLAKIYNVTLDQLFGEQEDIAQNKNEEINITVPPQPKKKPIRLMLEIDTEANEAQLPDFILKLQKLIEEQNNSTDQTTQE